MSQHRHVHAAPTPRTRKPGTWEVRVLTTDEWYGTVEANSMKQAERLAQELYNDGELHQCEEEIVAVIAYKPRTRIGSWRTFERRFGPIDGPDGATYWSFEQLPKPVDHRRVWTIVDGGNGKLYVTPGLRLVNRVDYIYCATPWTDEDEHQPDYRYD